MRSAENAARVQSNLLAQLIRKHAASYFGRDHDFANIRTYNEFVSRVPIQTYESLRPYVDRVLAGETEALLARGQNPLMFAMTSGSTDLPKFVPVTREFLSEYRRGWNVYGVSALADHPSAWMRGILQVTSPMDESRTERGVPRGAISGLLAASQKKLVQKYYVCPSIVNRISDSTARYYTIMRLSIPRDVAWMITASPATQVCLGNTAAAHADQIIKDIHDGTLTAPGPIPDMVRSDLQSRLRPDVATARRLQDLANKHGELLPKHYWRLSLLSNWTGGSMKLHLQQFPRLFGETPIRDIGLLATEGRVSIPFQDHSATGVLDVESSFFEFVETGEHESGNPDVRQCHELTPGHTYRVIMSTSAGFFRYDLGDHVLMHGYHGQAPIVEFLHRGAFVSSMTGEKLTEWQVTTAFERSCISLGITPTTFVLSPVWGEVPAYRLHVEQVCPSIDKLIQGFDEELCRLNIEYSSKRNSNRLGPISINVLPAGILSERNAARSKLRGVANEQFKHRYLLSNPGEDSDLLAAGIATCVEK